MSKWAVAQLYLGGPKKLINLLAPEFFLTLAHTVYKM